MDRSFFFAIIGPDRPGLVELMSDAVIAHEGNWLDSRMASLADHFVGVARVTIPENNAQAFASALQKLEETGLRVMLEPAGKEPSEAPKRKLAIQLMGHDRPGIVRDISRVLHKHSVNISELRTGAEGGPMSGETIFRATAEIDLPPPLSVEQLKRDLEALSQEIMVDLDVREAKT
jgi:glycine cleavage system regulatory protein